MTGLKPHALIRHGRDARRGWIAIANAADQFHARAELTEAPTFPDFLTLPAYDLITMEGG